MTTRVHPCPSCTCGDEEPPVQVDPTAPFYPLVLLVDSIAHHEMLLRSYVTKAQRSVA